MEPSVLFPPFLKHFGVEFLTWTPDARKEVLEKYSHKPLTLLLQNMLEAMVTISVTNSPWKDCFIFEKIVWALNGHVPNMILMEVPSSFYVAYAVMIMKSINKTEEFSEEVKEYIASILHEDGLCFAPPPLEFCLIYLQKLGATPENIKLGEETMKRWELIKDKIESIELSPSDPLDAQLSKLAVINLYLERKKELIMIESNKNGEIK